MSVEKMISRLMTVFGPPNTDDVEGFLNEYERSLKGYFPEVIEAATDKVIDTKQFWPRPAEIREIAMAAASRISPKRTDWDAVEAERRQGWKFSDLGKVKVSEESRAEIQRLTDEFKRNMASIASETNVEHGGIDWKRCQRPGFEEMQRNSPNQGLHRRRA